MDAYCRKKLIMEDIEKEREKVYRRIGKYFVFVPFLFSWWGGDVSCVQQTKKAKR
jgi:hypothetical protein